VVEKENTKPKQRQDQELGVREIINDLNYYDMLKNFQPLVCEHGL